MIIRHDEHLKMSIQTFFKYLGEMSLFTIKKCTLIKYMFSLRNIHVLNVCVILSLSCHLSLIHI
jgi:hypothetical protein